MVRQRKDQRSAMTRTATGSPRSALWGPPGVGWSGAGGGLYRAQGPPRPRLPCWAPTGRRHYPFVPATWNQPLSASAVENHVAACRPLAYPELAVAECTSARPEPVFFVFTKNRSRPPTWNHPFRHWRATARWRPAYRRSCSPTPRSPSAPTAPTAGVMFGEYPWVCAQWPQLLAS